MKPNDEWVAVAIILILVAGLFLMVEQHKNFKAEAIKRGTLIDIIGYAECASKLNHHTL